MSQPRTTQILEGTFGTVESFKTSTIFEDLLFDGHSYTVAKRITIPGSGTGGGIFDVVIDPTGYVSPTEIGKLFVFPPALNALGGEYHLDFYSEPTYSGGTPYNGFNRIFSDVTPSQVDIDIGVTTTDPGTKIDNLEWFIPSQTGGFFSASTSVTISDRLPAEFDPTKKILFRFINQSATAGTIGFRMTWFET
ncbi:MAG: hypothetical protein GY679_01345 [Mycoplasma sp.]|nr:hypothetical protein [Mycoplasma sp.]